MPSDTPTPELTFDEKVDNFRTRAKAFRDEHGSVEAVVSPSHPFAKLGITSIDRVPIEVEEITFMDTTDEGKPDVKLGGGMVYFHRDDHSMFGSKAVIEDDDWGWDD
ncbi:hypothetical protein SEA_LTON_55 [Gordonia phage Lton]|nr:hypothetical protein SEA_LTON_55 [Gordonia phage Lton]